MLSFLKKLRIKKFLDELPNAMDVIVRGVRSGLPLGDCLRIIAAEAQEPVRSEFRTIVESQALGISVGDSIAKLYERVPVAEANFFASSSPFSRRRAAACRRRSATCPK